MQMSGFQSLIDAWYEPLYRFALSLSRNGDEALDLTQQTFARWAEKGHHLRNADRAKSWLFTVLYREFLDTRRRKQREIAGDAEAALDAQATQTPSAAHTRVDSETVVAALFELDDIFRIPITLFFLESHSYKEIAAILDVPIGTVMSRISRGKQHLRTRLEIASASGGNVLPMPNLGENRQNHG